MSSHLLKLSAVCLVTAVWSAASLPAEPELLPAPKLLVTPAPTVVVAEPPAGYHRRSAYEVWQHYGRDSSGFFRPLVIYTPYGSFYSGTGAPYPFLPVNPSVMMPFALD